MHVKAWTVLCSVMVARSAFAAQSDVAVPPSVDRAEAAPASKSERVHDGFYLRVASGGGVMGVQLNPEPAYTDQADDEAGISFDVLIGASPARGVATGGGLLLDLMPSAGLGSDDAPLLIGLVGPFVDVYPNPTLGWHFGGMLGLAGLSLHAIDSDRHSLLGFGGAIWGGKEFWVGDQWSVGGGLRLALTQTRGDTGAADLNATSLSASLLLTAVHH